MSDTKKIELAPCPFCGGRAELHKTNGIFWINCPAKKCGVGSATLTKLTETEVAEAWNKRVPHALLQAKADCHDELVKACKEGKARIEFLQRHIAALEKDVAALEKDVAALEKDVQHLVPAVNVRKTVECIGFINAALAKANNL